MAFSPRREALLIAFTTLAGIYLVFLQFLPPLRAVHLTGDIEGYHYPLLDYTFQSLKEGRFPLWDPWIYCGTSFVGNMQAQIFYPPSWILFSALWHRKGLTFMSLQIFTLAHIWILVQFTYWWLRSGRGLPVASALIGATVLGFSGYIFNDLQHTGVMCALAWLPLALWGVDRRRMWMIALASALSLLAGYPATWIACTLATAAYTLAAQPAFAIRAAAAMVLALGLAAVQLLPTMQLAGLRVFESVFGGGSPIELLLHRLTPVGPGPYLYYGAGFLLAVILFFTKRPSRTYVPALVLAAVALLFMQDPFGSVSSVARNIPTLIEVIQHWHFQIVLSAAAALFTALAWAPLAKSRPALALAVVPLLWFEQYWFGVRGAGFRGDGNTDRFFKDDARLTGEGVVGMDPVLAQKLRSQPEFRIVTESGPNSTDMRFYRFTNPEGFDPMLTSKYKAEVEQYTQFQTNREFKMPIDNEAILKAFAVRYYVSSENAPNFKALGESKIFKIVEPTTSYYRIFEYIHAQPGFRFPSGIARLVRWTPEVREFSTSGEQPGDLLLLEQGQPGWGATIDGSPAPVGLHSKAFQKVSVPAGNHTVRFEYRAPMLGWGGLASAACLVVLLLLYRRSL